MDQEDNSAMVFGIEFCGALAVPIVRSKTV